jgi:D-alanine-D-alanine ligase
MNIAILHNAVADSDSEADRDVLVQVEVVDAALRALSHSTQRIAGTLNLEAIEESLTAARPDLVFNLVEALGGSDRLAHLAAMLLEDLDLPYTGVRAAAMQVTTNKLLTKERLRAAGLPTPDWVVGGLPALGAGEVFGPPYIIKAIWEHASVGIDDHAVIERGDGSLVMEQVESRSRQLGRACFAERFISGREFNLSLIAAGDGPKVLPPAEIDFSSFPEDKPKIVGYAAKWTADAFEFANTPRNFEFSAADAPLLDWLRALAVQCWEVFELSGYARVDFRVDADGRPWILEINSNPCLSPDAGFAAALARANLALERAVEWIVADAVGRKGSGVRGQESGVRSQGPGVRGQGSGVGGQGLRTRLRESGSEGRDSIEAKTVLSTKYSVLSTEFASRQPEPKATSKRRPQTKLRTEVRPSDREAVQRIVESTELFRPGEIDVAVELVDARLAKGAASGYEFVFAEQKGQVVGYACFGRNTLTASSFDVYWIAVDPSKQGQGIGRVLLDEAERQIADSGGTRIYIETSHRPDYQATRGFYERCGYRLEAVLEDFYAPGDGKAVYVKKIVA